jgi:hypothetical protein
MHEQVNAHMALFWSLTGTLAVGLCVVTGVLFGQAALWGSASAAAALYIGAIGIWFSRRGSSITSRSPKASYVRGIALQIGSPEFSDLIHSLADRIDDPIDIIDIARRAGVKMSSLRSGGSQSPLSLWTAILTQAVRDGKVESLIAEAN